MGLRQLVKSNVAKASAAVAVGAVAAGLLVSGGAAAADTWKCTVTGENGGTHTYTVTGVDASEATDACKTAWVNSAKFAVQDTTPPTTTTSTSSTTTTSSTTSTTTTPPPPPGNGYPSLAGPYTFDGDFDPSGQITGSNGGWPVNESGSDHPGTASIVTSPRAEGSYAAKFSIPASQHGRAEVQAPTFQPDPNLSFEELVYFPSLANHGPRHGSVGQTKMNNNPCYNGGLVLSDRISGDHLAFSVVPSCGAGSTHYDLGPTPRDHWVGIRVDEKFANAGSLKVQIDPDGPGPAGYAVALNKPAPFDTATVSSASVKVRQGLYYHNPDPQEVHVYGDGFHLKKLP